MSLIGIGHGNVIPAIGNIYGANGRDSVLDTIPDHDKFTINSIREKTFIAQTSQVKGEEDRCRLRTIHINGS